MAFIPIPNTVLVRVYLKTAVAELKASLSLYFSREGFDKGDMDDLLAHLEANFCDDLMTPLDESYELYLLEAYDMTAVDGYKATLSTAIPGGNAGTDTPESPVLSCVVTFRGAKRGKWNQGRNYVCGFSEQAADQVDIQQATVDAIVAAYQGLIDDPPTGWTWVIASRYLNGLPRTAGVVTPVDACLVRSNRFGIQRRRAQRS